MSFTRLASFPNSRVKPRNATRESLTPKLDLSEVIPNEPFLIAEGRADRTRLSIANKTATKLFYSYSNSSEIAPEVEDFNSSLDTGLGMDVDSLQSVWGLFKASFTGSIEIDEGIG